MKSQEALYRAREKYDDLAVMLEDAMATLKPSESTVQAADPLKAKEDYSVS